MMKTNIRKYLVLACCAVLLVCVSVGATIAYMTSTDTVTNTFTVGNVKITLDEAKVNDKGLAITGEDAERVKANTYKLYPGMTYDKDPTVHVDASSEDAYLRLKVTITNAAATDKLFEGGAAALFTGLDLSKWTVTSVLNENDERIYTFVYNTIVKADDDIVFFTNVVVPSTLDNDDMTALNNTKITIVAEAVQSEGFDNAAAAFAASFDAAK